LVSLDSWQEAHRCGAVVLQAACTTTIRSYSIANHLDNCHS
jgi:hypothetical protein